MDLTKGLDRPIEGYRWGGPPLVVGDVIVVGGIMTAGGLSQPGDVRGYNVRTGRADVDVPHDPSSGGIRERHLAERLLRKDAGAAGVWTGNERR